MHVATRSLYSNQQQKVDPEDLLPSIPQSSMPVLGVSGSSSSGSHTTQHRPSGPLLLPLKSACPIPNPCRLKPSEPFTKIDDQPFNKFCDVEPFTLVAANLVHDIVQGESELFKIPQKRQIALMYKVFQYCWLWSLGELPLLVHA
jgi:hypothetical protein